jgi:hypothetical protein
MYLFFAIGSVFLVDYLKGQVIGVITDSARAAGNGAGGGLMDGITRWLGNTSSGN